MKYLSVVIVETLVTHVEMHGQRDEPYVTPGPNLLTLIEETHVNVAIFQCQLEIGLCIGLEIVPCGPRTFIWMPGML